MHGLTLHEIIVSFECETCLVYCDDRDKKKPSFNCFYELPAYIYFSNLQKLNSGLYTFRRIPVWCIYYAYKKVSHH